MRRRAISVTAIRDSKALQANPARKGLVQKLRTRPDRLIPGLPGSRGRCSASCGFGSSGIPTPSNLRLMNRRPLSASRTIAHIRIRQRINQERHIVELADADQRPHREEPRFESCRWRRPPAAGRSRRSVWSRCYRASSGRTNRPAAPARAVLPRSIVAISSSIVPASGDCTILRLAPAGRPCFWAIPCLPAARPRPPPLPSCRHMCDRLFRASQQRQHGKARAHWPARRSPASFHPSPASSAQVRDDVAVPPRTRIDRTLGQFAKALAPLKGIQVIMRVTLPTPSRKLPAEPMIAVANRLPDQPVVDAARRGRQLRCPADRPRA